MFQFSRHFGKIESYIMIQNKIESNKNTLYTIVNANEALKLTKVTLSTLMSLIHSSALEGCNPHEIALVREWYFLIGIPMGHSG